MIMSFFTDLKKCRTLEECQKLFDNEIATLKTRSVYKSQPERLDKRVKQLLTDVDNHMNEVGIDGYIVVPSLDLGRDSIFKSLGFYKTIFYWVSPIFIAIFLILTFNLFFKISEVSGHSMDPTLKDGTYLVSSKFSKLNRFDIVIANELDSNGQPYAIVKRIIGLPGDTIEYKDDILYVNGKVVGEPYLADYMSKFKAGVLEKEYNNYDQSLRERIRSTPSFTTQVDNLDTGEKNEDIAKFKTVVPEGTYYLVGDNRLVSKDSRQVGYFSKNNIVGKVVLSNIGG